jgi:hypothetical protein
MLETIIGFILTVFFMAFAVGAFILANEKEREK